MTKSPRIPKAEINGIYGNLAKTLNRQTLSEVPLRSPFGFKNEKRLHDPAKENPMNLSLWIIAGLLAVVFLAGSAKLFVPKEKLATMPGGGWVEDFSPGTLKAIGALEALAAVGLILPAALDIAPVLVPLAALGGVLLMVGAIITRLRRHEAAVAVDLAYLAVAAFVVWGRFGPESFTG